MSLSNRHQHQRSKLWTQLKASLTSYIKPCSCLPHHVNPTNNTPEYIQPLLLSFQGLHGRINILESSDVNVTTFKSFTPSHPPARRDKGSFVSNSTCLALHVPRCFVSLCAHLFKGLPFSLHLSLSLSPSLPHPPLFPLVICFPPVGFGIPFIERTLFASYPFLRMGPERQNGRLWVPWSLLAPCHTMMSWLLFAAGAPIDFPSVLHTLYLPSFTLPNLHSCFPPPVPFPDSFASQKAPGGFGDVWMLFKHTHGTSLTPR